MKKTRIQSPLDHLPLHVKQTIAAWLTTGGPHGHGITYKEARVKLLTEYGVRCGQTALCKFFQRQTRASGVRAIDAVLPPGSDTLTLVINVRIRDKNTSS